jgi:hypothetical protein
MELLGPRTPSSTRTLPSPRTPSSARVQSALASYWEPISGARFLVTRPEDSPSLWAQYLDGLERTYTSFGVEAALDLGAIFHGRRLPVFAVALGPDGNVVAGVRAHGPLQAAAEAHALLEFAADPTGQRTVRGFIDERVSGGIAELKGGWVDDQVANRRELSNALARSFLHIMGAMGVQFGFCTAAVHAANRWSTVGGRPIDGLAPVAYPDERYQTTLMWWDATTFDRYCEADQLARIRIEQQMVCAQEGSARPSRVAALAGYPA